MVKFFIFFSTLAHFYFFFNFNLILVRQKLLHLKDIHIITPPKKKIIVKENYLSWLRSIIWWQLHENWYRPWWCLKISCSHMRVISVRENKYKTFCLFFATNSQQYFNKWYNHYNNNCKKSLSTAKKICFSHTHDS